MNIFRKISKDIKYINLEEYANYDNCIYLNFTSDKEVNLFDYNTKKFIETIKF